MGRHGLGGGMDHPPVTWPVTLTAKPTCDENYQSKGQLNALLEDMQIVRELRSQSGVRRCPMARTEDAMTGRDWETERNGGATRTAEAESTDHNHPDSSDHANAITINSCPYPHCGSYSSHERRIPTYEYSRVRPGDGKEFHLCRGSVSA